MGPRPTRETEGVVLFVATLAAFLTPFMGSATNVALPAIGREFALDAVALSWIATAYPLSAAVFLVPFGKLADIRGRRLVLASGLVVYTVASLLCALAPSAGLLRAARVVQGVGGSMIFGTGVALTMYGLGRLPGVTGVALLAAGLATLAAFVAWALHAPQPVLDITLFRANRVFALSNLASLRLQYVDGLTSKAAGMLLAVQPLVQTGISPFAGRLSDRVDSRVVASAGMGLTAVALALFGCLGAATSQAFVLACVTLLGAGLGLFASPNTNAVMASVERHFYGVASAILATMRLVGQMLSIGLAALVLALFVGHEPMVPARHAPFLAALRAAFFGFSVLCAAGTLASLARGQTATAVERQP